MVKHNRKKFFAAIAVAFLSFSSPLIFTSYSWAQASSDAQITTLIEKLKSNNKWEREDTVMALVKIGQPAVPPLIGALKNPDKRVRTHTASALARMGEQAKAAIPALIAALKDTDKNVRSSAAFALGRMGEQAKVAIPALIAALKTPDKDVRRYAALALENIAVSLQEKAKANALSKSDLEQAITDLEAALEILENPENKFSIRLIDAVRLPLNVLKAKKNAHLFNWILQNAWVWIPGMYMVSLFGVFWIRPLWLLKIDELFKQLDFKVSFLGVEKSLRSLLFLKYHSRVLDAWVEAHIQSAREEFQKKDTVSDRTIHIPVDAKLIDKSSFRLKGEDLRLECGKNPGCTIIWGEEGAGKTSLACQIGEWAIEGSLCLHQIIPVLIEEDLDFNTQGKYPFLEAIRRQVRYLADEAKLIDEELLKHLLQRQRILVIVERFSQMSEKTRHAIESEIADFPINALVITASAEDTFKMLPKLPLSALLCADIWR